MAEVHIIDWFEVYISCFQFCYDYLLYNPITKETNSASNFSICIGSIYIYLIKEENHT